MTKKTIPTPTCPTCGESDDKNYISGETSYRCPNCGTELRYMPAGELLNPDSTAVAKNKGWVIRFSVLSSELYYSQAMLGIGIVILILTLTFVCLGKIGLDDAVWSFGSGILLTIIGKRKLSLQKKKTQTVLSRYPHWKK